MAVKFGFASFLDHLSSESVTQNTSLGCKYITIDQPPARRLRELLLWQVLLPPILMRTQAHQFARPSMRGFISRFAGMSMLYHLFMVALWGQTSRSVSRNFMVSTTPGFQLGPRARGFTAWSRIKLTCTSNIDISQL